MSENLEDKYQYMCELVEDQAREIFEYKKIAKENQVLKDHIGNICALIYYQEHLKHQDAWLKNMIKEGYYTVDPEDGCSKLYSVCMCMECLG